MQTSCRKKSKLKDKATPTDSPNMTKKHKDYETTMWFNSDEEQTPK